MSICFSPCLGAELPTVRFNSWQSPEIGTWGGVNNLPAIEPRFKAAIGKVGAVGEQILAVNEKVVYVGAGVAQAVRRAVPEQARHEPAVHENAGGADENVRTITANLRHGK
ncbi:MAG: hypothetical protein BroJett015_39290 [Chloroflexota bacterium]|nr:MAG: hypothetical protein BroJett015_39290 [Chloroflexota bacterium]